jgi:hypothetical protein
MKKFYTCHFDSVKVGKKVLHDLNFASLDKKLWIGVNSYNLTIFDYDKLKLLFKPVKIPDGKSSMNMLISIITIVDLAEKTNKPLLIKKVA